jgi:hypothetical protein
MPTCISCHTEFPDYKELALHIMTNRKGHRKGRRWAAKYIMVNGLSSKVKGQKYDRIALTEEQKEAKKDCKITISGINKVADTVCPKCSLKLRQLLPVEYVQSPMAWRKDNKLVILCDGCGSKG